MATSYLTDHATAVQEADVDDGVPQGIDVWKRTIPTGRYRIDAEHSRAEFVTRKMKLYPVDGTIDGIDGHVRIADPIDTSDATITLDASTIDTGLGARDAHLRSSMYLAAQRHPELRFDSEHVQPLGNDTYAVHGQLTIKGITEPAVFHVTMTDTYQQPDATVIRFIATADIDRRAFRVPSPEAAALWGLVVDPTVTVRLHLAARIDRD